MSGYFSRIARAGGARFSVKEVRQNAGTKASTKSHLAPIDIEETVMVSPPERREPGPAINKRSGGVILKQTRQESSGQKPVTGVRQTAQPSKHHAAIAPNAPEETRVIDTQDERHAPGTPALESSVDRNEPVPSRADRDRPEHKTSDPQSPETTRPEVSEKRFFESTAAIVEGRPAEPAEAQTIVLREVQEWIAAGHIPSAEIVPDDIDDRPVSDRYDKPGANEPEPGVVRIVNRDRPDVLIDTEHKTSAQHSIEEQNFELSIGSISVVVEGEDTLPQAAQAVVTRPAPAQDATRSVSRLSRHYL